MADMTKRERVMAAVKGEPVDRVPLSFYGHNHRVEHSSADKVVAHILKQNAKFGWDFMKVQLRPNYYGEAWGCEYRWNPETGPNVEDYVVKSAEDFRKLDRLEPTKGVLGEQVRIAKLLGEALKGSLPYVQTIFSPLTVAGRLAGAKPNSPLETRIAPYLKENPEALHHGLSVISQTLADYAREVIRAGADGVFLCTTCWSSRDTLTEKEYKVFARPYDLAVYEAAIQEGATFNILHMSRENIMFDLLSEYPVQVITYNALSPRNPSLREAMGKTDKALWGGINHVTTLLNGPMEAIVTEVHSALDQTGGRRFLLGPYSGIPSRVPDLHLIVAKEALSTWQGG